MASGWTNRGKYANLNLWFRNTATQLTSIYCALFTSATSPTVDIDTFSQLTEIAAGNGYTTGGYQLTRNDTDFDVLTEDDANDRALCQAKDIVWSASGGSIPDTGDGARWACFTDANATIASREIHHWFDLVSDRQVSDGQNLTLQDCEARINTPA